MIPIDLTVTNFCRYANAHLVFDFRSAVVVGETGSGKSTLFVDGVLWVLYGQCRAPGLDDVIKRGEDACAGAFEFEAQGERRKVTRTRSKSGRGTGTLDYLVQLEGGAWECRNGASMRETQAAIERDLGADYATAVVTSFMIQGKSNAFPTAPRRERMALLAQMVGAERFDGYGKVLSDTRRTAKAERDAVERAAEELEARSTGPAAGLVTLRDDGRVPTCVEAALDEVCERREAVTRVSASLVNARESERKALEAVDVNRDSVAKARAVRSEIAAHQEWVRKSEAEVSALLLERENVVRRIEADKAVPVGVAQVGNIEALRTDVAVAEDVERTATSAAEAVVAEYHEKERAKHAADWAVSSARAGAASEHAAGRKTLQAQHFSAQQAKANAQAHVDRVEIARKHLGETVCGGQGKYAACPLIVTAVKTIDDTDAASADLATAKTALDGMSALLAEYPASAADSPETLALVEKALVAKDAYDAAVDARGDALQRSVAADGKLNAARRAYDEASRNAAAWAAATERVKAAEARMAAIDARTAELRATLETERAAIAGLNAQLPADDPVAAQERLEAEVRAARQCVHDTVNALSHAEAAVVSAEARVAELHRLASQAAERRAEATALSTRIARLDAAVQGCRDAPQLMLESIIPAIEQKANELLARFSSNGMQLFLRTQAEQKTSDRLSETLDVVCVDDEGELPYEMYSGGEHYMVDLALRIALSWALAVRAGAPLETLVIDEGFGTLDPARLQAVAQSLHMAHALFQKVIVISHVAGLVQSLQVDARYRVTRSPGGSTIAREE